MTGAARSGAADPGRGAAAGTGRAITKWEEGEPRLDSPPRGSISDRSHLWMVMVDGWTGQTGGIDAHGLDCGDRPQPWHLHTPWGGWFSPSSLVGGLQSELKTTSPTATHTCRFLAVWACGGCKWNAYKEQKQLSLSRSACLLL
jgi:hypothetical protein